MTFWCIILSADMSSFHANGTAKQEKEKITTTQFQDI